MKRKKHKLYLEGPKGVTIRRRQVGDDVRLTTPNDGYESLVGLIRNNLFVWIRKGFRAIGG